MAQIIITEQNCMQIIGNLSFATIAQVYQKGLEVLRREPETIVDLSKVALCDSAGLAMLIAWYSKVKERKAKISFSNLPKQLHAIAEVSGVAKLFEDMA